MCALLGARGRPRNDRVVLIQTIHVHEHLGGRRSITSHVLNYLASAHLRDNILSDNAARWRRRALLGDGCIDELSVTLLAIEPVVRLVQWVVVELLMAPPLGFCLTLPLSLPMDRDFRFRWDISDLGRAQQFTLWQFGPSYNILQLITINRGIFKDSVL